MKICRSADNLNMRNLLLLFVLYAFFSHGGETLDPNELVSGVGMPASCDDNEARGPCKLSCENAVKASKIMGEIGQFLNSLDCQNRSCDLRDVDGQINSIIELGLGAEDVRNRELVKRAILSELSGKLSAASAELPPELSEEINNNIQAQDISRSRAQFNQEYEDYDEDKEYEDIKSKLAQIDKKVAQFQEAVPKAKRAMQEQGYLGLIGENIMEMGCMSGNCPTEFKSLTTAPKNIESAIDTEFVSIIQLLEQNRGVLQEKLNDYTPEYQAKQTQLLEKIDSYDKKLAYIHKLRNGVQMNVITPGQSSLRRTEEGMLDDAIMSDKIATSVYTTTAATLVAVYTGGLAGKAALGEGATMLSYMAYLGASGGSTYVAVEGGKDILGAAIESSSSGISFWCAMTQKIPNNSTDVLKEGLVVGAMSMLAGGALGYGMRSSISAVKNLTTAGAGLLLGYTAKALTYDTMNSVENLISENREAISPMCESILRSSAAGDVALDVGAFTSFLRLENSARTSMKSTPPSNPNGGQKPRPRKTRSAQPPKPDPNLAFIPEGLNLPQRKGLETALYHMDDINFGGRGNIVNVPIRAAENIGNTELRQLNKLMKVMSDKSFVKECLEQLSGSFKKYSDRRSNKININGKLNADDFFLSALKSDGFSAIGGEVDGMSSIAVASIDNVGGIYQQSGKTGAAQYTHAVRAYIFDQAYRKLAASGGLVDGNGNRITNNSQMNRYFKKLFKNDDDLYKHLFTGEDNRYMYEESGGSLIEGQTRNQGERGSKNALNDHYLTEIVDQAFSGFFDF